MGHYQSTESPAVTQEFIQKIRNRHLHDMPESEKKIWDFMIYFLEWLQQPSPRDTEELWSRYRDYVLALRKETGETGRHIWMDVERDFNFVRIKARLLNGHAKCVDFRLLEKVRESFLYYKLPPDFRIRKGVGRGVSRAGSKKGRVVQNQGEEEKDEGFEPAETLTQESLPDDGSETTTKLIVYQNQQRKLLAFFMAMKSHRSNRHIPRQPHLLMTPTVGYLQWTLKPLEKQNDQDLAQLHSKFRAEMKERYEGLRIEGSCRQRAYEKLLLCEVSDFKDSIREFGEKEDRKLVQDVLVVVDEVFEWLKSGSSGEARKRMQEFQAPPRYENDGNLQVETRERTSSEFKGPSSNSGKTSSVEKASSSDMESTSSNMEPTSSTSRSASPISEPPSPSPPPTIPPSTPTATEPTTIADQNLFDIKSRIQEIDEEKKILLEACEKMQDLKKQKGKLEKAEEELTKVVQERGELKKTEAYLTRIVEDLRRKKEMGVGRGSLESFQSR